MLLKSGSVGKEVMKWQGFLKLKQDGIFGEQTELATKAFQANQGLFVDGKVGAKTWQAAGFEVPKASYYPPKPQFNSPSNDRRKQMFGEFQWKPKGNGTDIVILGNWAKENIINVEIKQLIGVEGAPKNGIIQFHKDGAEQIKGFFNEVERQGLLHLVISWAGSFYPRFIRGSQRTLSNHSLGTAFDINAPQNWLGEQPAPVGAKGSLLELVPIANAFGFFWGGHYESRLDGMHFELAVSGLKPSKSFDASKVVKPIVLPKVDDLLNLEFEDVRDAVKEQTDIIGEQLDTIKDAPKQIENAIDEVKDEALKKVDETSDAVKDSLTDSIADAPFLQYLPDISKIKGWFYKQIGGNTLLNILAYFASLPDYIKIALTIILVLQILGLIGLVIYHRVYLFGLITKSLEYRADKTKNSPIIVTEMPTISQQIPQQTAVFNNRNGVS